jgi:hypothetical protein
MGCYRFDSALVHAAASHSGVVDPDLSSPTESQPGAVMPVSTMRIGGLCAAVGGLLTVSALATGLGAEDDLDGSLRATAGSDRFVVSGLLELVGLLLVFAGAIALVWSFAARPAGGWFVAVARPLVVVGGTVALAAAAIDLSAYRHVADVYAATPDSDAQSMLNSVLVLSAVLNALASLAGLLLLGVLPVLLAVAIYRTRLYPMWLAVVAAVAGIAEVVLNIIFLLPVYQLDLTIAHLLANLMILVVVAVAGVLLWRRGPGPAAATARSPLVQLRDRTGGLRSAPGQRSATRTEINESEPQ